MGLIVTINERFSSIRDINLLWEELVENSTAQAKRNNTLKLNVVRNKEKENFFEVTDEHSLVTIRQKVKGNAGISILFKVPQNMHSEVSSALSLAMNGESLCSIRATKKTPALWLKISHGKTVVFEGKTPFKTKKKK